MPGSTWLTSPVLLPSGATELGRLILDPETPSRLTGGQHSPPPEIAVTADDLKLERLETLPTNTESPRFNRFISNLALSSFGHNVQATSVLCKTYRLKSPERYFARLCSEDQEARRWLEENAGRSIYCVAGVKTLADMSNSEEFQTLREIAEYADREIDLSRPITQDLPGAFPCDMWDVGAGVIRPNDDFIPRTLDFRKEQVYAVQFRRVQLDMASSATAKDYGQGVRWKMFQKPVETRAGLIDVVDAGLTGNDIEERDFKEHSERLGVGWHEELLYLGPR